MNKLRYRGQTYFLSHQQIPTIASGNTACYRGHKYDLHVPVAIDLKRHVIKRAQLFNYKF